jgi:TonB family protein
MLARILAAVLIAAVSSAAPAEVPLQPTSKWNVDYDVAQCTASRNYGTEAEPLALILKPSPFGRVMRVLVVKEGRVLGAANEVQASVQFDNLPSVRTDAMRSSSKDRNLTVYSFNMPMDRFKAGQDARTITVSARGLSKTFAVSSIPALLTELEKCRLNLLEHYNASGSGIRNPATPLNPLTSIFSAEDYPMTALTGSDQGRVNVSVLVDEKGQVRDCSIDGSAGAATLDAISCYLIQKRASFNPATGADGKPVRSVYVQRVNWRIAE